jgi:hypothetical protein
MTEPTVQLPCRQSHLYRRALMPFLVGRSSISGRPMSGKRVPMLRHRRGLSVTSENWSTSWQISCHS